MEECLICKAPLEYLVRDEVMECAVCHKKEPSKTRCVNGHYVCNDCHTKGMDSIFGLCLSETSTDPIAIVRRMMDLPFCHMHGPEHHVMVGAALLTAYRNAGGALDLEKALSALEAAEAESRKAALPAVEIEPFLTEQVDFDTFCKSDFRAEPVVFGGPAAQVSARGSFWPSPQSLRPWPGSPGV